MSNTITHHSYVNAPCLLVSRLRTYLHIIKIFSSTTHRYIVTYACSIYIYVYLVAFYRHLFYFNHALDIWWNKSTILDFYGSFFANTQPTGHWSKQKLVVNTIFSRFATNQAVHITRHTAWYYYCCAVLQVNRYAAVEW